MTFLPLGWGVLHAGIAHDPGDVKLCTCRGYFSFFAVSSVLSCPSPPFEERVRTRIACSHCDSSLEKLCSHDES